jgi:predicted ATP-grasp superfamily ATP-dependent carboligase
LSNLKVRSLLIIGLDTTPIATSASRAGYEVYAVDYFGDQDVRRLCADSLSIVEEKPGKSCGKVGRDFSPEKLVRFARLLTKRHRIDGILLSSGVEDSPSALSDLAELAPILASPPEHIANVRDKASFFSELERLGISHPQTTRARGVREAELFARRVGYPVVVKPETGFGGAGILLARNREELAGAFAGNSKRLLVQEYVVGTPASVSLISSGERAVALTVNEQLIGVRELGLKEQFGWCGNIVPLSGPEGVSERARAVASRIVEHFGLVGSIGVDMVISRDGVPWVVEVNPRFQGTLECVEAVTGLNLVKLHVETCVRGAVPETPPVTGASARLIVYAPTRICVPDLSGVEGVRDLPIEAVIVEEGEPVCSVFSAGEDRRHCLSAAFARARDVLSLLRPL